MSNVVYLPKIEPLECSPDGKVDPVKLSEFYSSISRIPTRLRLAAVGETDLKCALEIELAATAIENLIKSANAGVTEPFTDLKSTELEARYQARDVGKEIELILKKKIVEILVKLIGVLGIPNPFETPIPFIGSAEFEDENGEKTTVQPVIADLFTKEGQAKIKKVIQKNKEVREAAKKAVGSDAFDGSLGIKAPDLETEELWHKIKNWFDKLINSFLTTVLEAIGKLLKKIPIIGDPIYKAVFSPIDPTVVIEEAYDAAVQKTKEEIKKEREAALKEKRKSIADDIMKAFIKKILDIKIPFVGKIGDLVDVNREKQDVVITEEEFYKVDDAFKQAIEKARRIFKGDIFAKIYDIIAKAPGYIISQFPIVGTVFKTLDALVKLTSGKTPLTECDRLNLLAPQLFLMATVTNALLPSKCLDIKFEE
jgi:hypothetical protein